MKGARRGFRAPRNRLAAERLFQICVNEIADPPSQKGIAAQPAWSRDFVARDTGNVGARRPMALPTCPGCLCWTAIRNESTVRDAALERRPLPPVRSLPARSARSARAIGPRPARRMPRSERMNAIGPGDCPNGGARRDRQPGNGPETGQPIWPPFSTRIKHDRPVAMPASCSFSIPVIWFRWGCGAPLRPRSHPQSVNLDRVILRVLVGADSTSKCRKQRRPARLGAPSGGQ